MSLFKQYISNEGIYNTVSLEDDGVEPTDAELVEAQAQAEANRVEAEATADEAVRVAVIGDELQNQNDALQAVADENGGEVPAPVAAGFELARRAAVAGLGIEPDSETGAEVVAAESLEGLVNGTVSLEEEKEKNEGFIQKVKDAAMKAWNWIKEKVSKFWNWLMKVTNIVSKKYRAAYNGVKALSDEEFSATLNFLCTADTFKLEEIEKDDGLATKLIKGGKNLVKKVGNACNFIPLGDGTGSITNGKGFMKSWNVIASSSGLDDIGEVNSAVGKGIDKLKLGFTGFFKQIEAKVKSNGYVNKDKENSESASKAYDELTQKWDENLSKIEYSFQLAGSKVTIKYNDGKPEIEHTAAPGDISKVTRKNLLDVLNQGTIATKLFERLEKAVSDDKAKIEKLSEEIGKSGQNGYVKYIGKCGQVLACQNTLVNIASKYQTEVLKFAKFFAPAQAEE